MGNSTGEGPHVLTRKSHKRQRPAQSPGTNREVLKDYSESPRRTPSLDLSKQHNVSRTSLAPQKGSPYGIPSPGTQDSVQPNFENMSSSSAPRLSNPADDAETYVPREESGFASSITDHVRDADTTTQRQRRTNQAQSRSHQSRLRTGGPTTSKPSDRPPKGKDRSRDSIPPSNDEVQIALDRKPTPPSGTDQPTGSMVTPTQTENLDSVQGHPGSSTMIQSQANSVGSPSKPSPSQKDSMELDSDPELLLQPETRPISLDQLVVEVKGIYAGLVMVETKCIDVDKKQIIAAQDTSRRLPLTSEQWSALIALHKTLLHEHHDFFLASQHPAASSALSKLAGKYSMPARMWRHGIHAFLEVLRFRLPDSLEYMLAFINISYNMMALLYETVVSFQDTWIECLGDLGRYRMAVEDDDLKDREIWSGVARFWYSKASDRNPSVGRLYHHLGILARPFTIQQLGSYSKSLTCLIPFDSTRTSIMTMFAPVLQSRESIYQRSSTMEIVFIHAHGILFIDIHGMAFPDQTVEKYKELVRQLIAGELLVKFISRAGIKFKEIGVSAAIANISALHNYGAVTDKGLHKSLLRLRAEEDRLTKQETISLESKELESSNKTVQKPENLSLQTQEESLRNTVLASNIAFSTLAVALRRPKDKNVFPMIHVFAVFLRAYSSIDKAMALVEREIPWPDIVSFCNSITSKDGIVPKLRSSTFPGQVIEDKPRPLPEDYAMRGMHWTDSYFPEGWFEDTGIDEEERALDLLSYHEPRKDRITWSFFQVAGLEKWITFDDTTSTFKETKYLRQLPEWDLSTHLAQPNDFTDIVMSGTVETAGEHAKSRQAVPADVSSSPGSRGALETSSPQRVQSPRGQVKILKRESSTGEHDRESRDRSRFKQESPIPSSQEVNPNRAWQSRNDNEPNLQKMKMEPRTEVMLADLPMADGDDDPTSHG